MGLQTENRATQVAKKKKGKCDSLTWRREEEEHRGAPRGANYLALIWRQQRGGWSAEEGRKAGRRCR